ncbi:hypothetical protein [Rhizobium sp. C4]|uniref:hypothetical protein n=1 Tax=Rhizobium sp. C4 TaxID=1349800 RepID=UPI001E55D3D5|nr:hypothetical protein [Rhizobium sp. C4]MCD2174288.1 hypothetical protein [Rhizobium sp. C4]
MLVSRQTDYASSIKAVKRRNGLIFVRALPLCLACIYLFLGVSNARADDWPSDRQKIETLLAGRDCASAWKTLWPWARTGNKDALNMIADGMFVHGMAVPGISDAISRLRYVNLFSIYGLQSKRSFAYKWVSNMYEIKYFTPSFQTCVKEAKTLSKCAQIAIDDRVLPEFKQFVREVDFLSEGKNSKCSLQELR